MKENKDRSNFALMDEMEEKEMLESKDTLYHERGCRAYEGKLYETLRKVGLTPLLAAGIIMSILCLAFPGFNVSIAGLWPVFLAAGIIEKIYLSRKERKEE